MVEKFEQEIIDVLKKNMPTQMYEALRDKIQQSENISNDNQRLAERLRCMEEEIKKMKEEAIRVKQKSDELETKEKTLKISEKALEDERLQNERDFRNMEVKLLGIQLQKETEKSEFAFRIVENLSRNSIIKETLTKKVPIKMNNACNGGEYILEQEEKSERTIEKN